MRIVCVGGGPAGLYAAARLKDARPDADVTVVERRAPGDEGGFGVVLSASALEGLQRADPALHRALTESARRWSDVRVDVRGHVTTATGGQFAAVDRAELLAELRRRCEAVGVELRHGESVRHMEAWAARADLLIGADGASSRVRDHIADDIAPSLALGQNRFIWLGTSLPVDAFTFWLRQSEHGAFCVHAYRYGQAASTFIAECAEATWRRAGLDRAGERESLEYLQRLFAPELRGHRLVARRSSWRRFASVRARRWHAGRVVLIGDAAHAAHFSVGSGTRLAMDDALELARALAAGGDTSEALARYEAARRPQVERLAEAARASQAFFERIDAYAEDDPADVAHRLLARTGRTPRTMQG